MKIVILTFLLLEVNFNNYVKYHENTDFNFLLSEVNFNMCFSTMHLFIVRQPFLLEGQTGCQ